MTITEHLENALVKMGVDVDALPDRLMSTLLSALCDNVGGGSSGGGTSAPSDWNAAEGLPGHVLNRTHWVEKGNVEILDGIFTSKYDSSTGFFGVFYQWFEHLDETPQTMSVEFDGGSYNGMSAVNVPNMGTATGNLYYLNSLAGTSFENTGEPFLIFFGVNGGTFFVLDTEPKKHSIRITIPGNVSHKLPVEFTPYTLLDLNKLGFPQIPSDHSEVELEIDCTDIIKQLYKGIVKLRFTVEYSSFPITAIVSPWGTLDYVHLSFMMDSTQYHFTVYENKITGRMRLN